ncbi:glycosyltransferase [Gracilimonas mengyeensis]|uniref:Glycosyltransferase involved in cell wall bisynthesis n=1 Tax=Gracilimonas mengyeensis TaxID=1302730 RepID=A0A521DRN5_9BACT|nr:glycosyltransferase [Gracilimonas mengyeensis]SMO74413.1 Glycosyltransferase involved in cell wall bisynthesis [Gracilimonas mengyeensis]
MISILSVFPPYRGGIATFSDYLYRNLDDITDVNAYNFSYLYPSFLFPGKSQFTEDDAAGNYAKRIFHSCNPFNWKKTARQILEDNPDHVILCYWHPFFALALLKVMNEIKKQRPKLPVHVLAHNVVPHESFPLGHRLSKALLDKADTLILLSEKSCDEAKKIGVSSTIIKLFHPVYEQKKPIQSRNSLRNAFGYSNKDKVFLFFGLVRPYKGLDLFIEALNTLDLEKHHIRPLIVGEFYTDKEPILSKIKDTHRGFYTIDDRFVSEEEMAELFTLSDALVMPYRSASQSGILANAINFHLPSIVTNLKGLTEHIEHQKTAWVVEKEDVKDLSKAILSLTDPNQLKEIKAALIPLKEQLSWKMFTKQLITEISEEIS